jgi:predicted O-methyltransferase YrrM
MAPQSSLRSGPVREVLDRLHGDARGDRLRFLSLAPRLLAGRLAGRKLFDVMTPEAMREFFIPVSREQGELLYLTARAIGARTIVEFGTSFAISTIYLAAAARANGGHVVGTEMEPAKVKAARANVAEAGLAQFVDIREGDAMKTLATLAGPVDFLFLDGWKDIYLPMVKMLSPKMRAGAVVLADNIFTFKRTLRPYVAHMQDRANGFESVTLPIGHGMEYSLRLE